MLIIVSVWASKIAGLTPSVAAVGAILIVSKELVMCVHGYFYGTLVQPYKIGDLIEFNQLRGRVVDIDMFATTLVALDKAGQRTGKVAEFPNAFRMTWTALKRPHWPLPTWREVAMTHFRNASEENFIALPSGKTKVSWDFSDPEHLVLLFRVAYPIEQRALSPAPQTVSENR